jgi:hypothetical protein
MIGLRLDPFTTAVGRDRIRRFATAVGEPDPIFHDLRAARAAGHPDLPLPPTLLFGVAIEHEGDALLSALGVVPEQVLHVEQLFTYHRPAHAREELTFRSELVDLYHRRDNRLTFAVQETEITRAGEAVMDLRQVLMRENS